MRRLLIILFWISGFHGILAQSQDVYRKFVQEIRTGDLKECVYYLSASDLAGREAGTAGERKAAEWIESKMRILGLTGFSDGKDPFVQPFRFYRSRITNALLCCGTDTLHERTDFFMAPIYDGDNQFELVYAGRGTEKEVESADVKGKIAVLQPPGWIYNSTYREKSLSMWDIVTLLEKHGAAGMMYAYPDETFRAIPQTDNYVALTVQDELPEQNPAQRDTFRYILTTKKTLAVCIGMTLVQLRDSILLANKKGKSLAGHFRGKIEVQGNARKEKVNCRNVLGMVKGTTKKDELVVVSAHYDHLGKKGTSYFPGADDNASGVGALLSLAKLFSKAASEGYRPERTIVFAAFSAEEDGELGSSWFVRNLHKKVVINLNMDMIGRRDTLHPGSDHYVYYLTDTAHWAVITRLLDDAGKKNEIGLNQDPTLNNDDFLDYFNRSDQRSFSVEGIPFVVFTTGEHDDYHQFTDTPEKVNLENIREIAVLVGSLAWDFANGNPVQ